MSSPDFDSTRLQQGWARSLMKNVRRRLRDLKALVQDILGKLAPEGVMAQPT